MLSTFFKTLLNPLTGQRIFPNPSKIKPLGHQGRSFCDFGGIQILWKPSEEKWKMSKLS
jgi:hypothetical protein